MKKITSLETIIMSLLLLVFLWPLQGNGQRHSKSEAPWLSDKGFWILENNIKNPRETIVYFYNLDKALVYREQINGIRLNLKKKKVLVRLKNVLEQSVNNWEVQHILPENRLWLATAFHRK